MCTAGVFIFLSNTSALRFRGICWQKLNIIFLSMFSSVYYHLKIKIVECAAYIYRGCGLSSLEAAMLHCHVFTIVQSRQTKHWH